MAGTAPRQAARRARYAPYLLAKQESTAEFDAWLPHFAPGALLAHMPARIRAKRKSGGRPALFMYEEFDNPNFVDADGGGDDAFATETFETTPAEVLDAAKRNQRVYYTEEANAALSGALDRCAPNWRALAQGAVDDAPVRCSLWVSSDKCSTHAHYDAFDNTIVQLNGKKHVALWPPNAHFDLRTYSDAHPRARKSRLPDPLAHLAPWRVVTLEPGMAMRIPPFWFHHVEASAGPDDGCVAVSLNVFADAHVRREAATAFRASAHAVQQGHAATALDAALKRVGMDGGLARLCSRILWSRFDALSVSAPPVSHAPSPTAHPTDVPDDVVNSLVDALRGVRTAATPSEDDADLGAHSVVAAHMAELTAVLASGGPTKAQDWLRRAAAGEL